MALKWKVGYMYASGMLLMLVAFNFMSSYLHLEKVLCSLMIEIATAIIRHLGALLSRDDIFYNKHS